MSELINKYRKNELTGKELLELRANINSMTNEDVGRKLYESWMEDDIDTDSVNDEIASRIKKNIDTNIGIKNPTLSSFIFWFGIAAAILLPVFILSTVYFYNESNFNLSEEMLVATGKAERASITLPDGTMVSLNAESKLGYLPKSYNKKDRKVHFSGEGYFQVFQNKEVPFYIQAEGLQVKVLGTVFNLSVRQKSRTAVLALEKGSVSLLSTKNSENVILHKNQKAILDYATGNITVFTDANIKDASAWKRGDMIFRHTELSQVIRAIEESYNVTIHIDSKENLTDLFTGTLPINDLNEVLEVIEYTYHLKATISGKEIIMEGN